MRSNPINPYPRAEKEMSAAINSGHSTIALAWNRRVEKKGITKSILILNKNKRVPILRFNIKAEFGQGLSNILPLIKWQFQLMKWLYKNRKNYDLIHAYDFDTVLPALLMKIFFKKKYIYDICDFYIDAFHVPKFIKPLIKKMDFLAINKAEKTILVNETRLSQIKGSKPKEIVFIHNTPIDTNIKYEKCMSFSKPTIFYGGILSDRRMILETIEICKRHKEWNLFIAGYGRLEKECEKAANNYKNIKFIGKKNYDEIINYTRKATVIFACYDPSVPNHKYSSPNKLYEAMMCGKPIVVSKDTGVDELVVSEKIGISCNYNEQSLEEAYSYLLNNRDISEEMGSRARKLYDEKYNWEIMENRIEEMYKTIK